MYFWAEKMMTQDVGAARRASTTALLRDSAARHSIPRDTHDKQQQPAKTQQSHEKRAQITSGTAAEKLAFQTDELNSAILRHNFAATEKSKAAAGTPTSAVVPEGATRHRAGTPTAAQGVARSSASGAASPPRKRHSANASGRAGSVGNIGVLVGAGRHAGRKVLVNVVRAFLVRALFVVHSLTTIWAAVNVRNDPSIWTFALVSALIAIEGAYTIVLRAGAEHKWFSPSVLLYILATAPPLHLLERQICEWRKSQNAEELDEKIHFQLLEQLLLVILIVGRWLLPKGEISREQLSQILLAYLAISSDIVEFFDVFKERVVYQNYFVQQIVLGAWTLSLLQFPFVLTVSRARKMRVAINDDEKSAAKRHAHLSQMFYDIDLWSIFLANGLQDIPFFIVRLYLMAYHGLVTYTMIFFICKNALIIVLQTYRAFILLNDRYINPKSELRRRSNAEEARGLPANHQRRRPTGPTLATSRDSSEDETSKKRKREKNSEKRKFLKEHYERRRNELEELRSAVVGVPQAAIFPHELPPPERRPEIVEKKMVLAETADGQNTANFTQ